METQAQTMSLMPRRELWNKGKLVGQEPPLRPEHVWSIRTRLQMEGRTRDLAMFNLAIDSKLRGCDVVALRVEQLHRGKGEHIDKPRSIWRETRGIWHTCQISALTYALSMSFRGKPYDPAGHSLADRLAAL